MRRSTLACLIVIAACAGGCTSAPRQTSSMGAFGPEPTVISLGAGDSLGRAVYVNDMILAAAALNKETTFTNVDEGSIELLFDQH